MNQALITQLFAGFAGRYGDTIRPEQRLVCQRLVDSFDAHLAAEAAPDRPMGLVHGDYRLDNLLFGRPGSPRDLTVVDWQTVTWGQAMTDVAYFLGCALRPEDRRAHYEDLLGPTDGLGPNPPLSLDEVREGVRRQSFFGVMMTIVSSMLVERTDRGDRMFLTMLDRHGSHVMDTGALEVLPQAEGNPALQPDPRDEAAHTGDEPLWNESWYWDFADPGQGGWLDPAGADPEPEGGLDQRADLWTGHSHSSPAGLRRPGAGRPQQRGRRGYRIAPWRNGSAARIPGRGDRSRVRLRRPVRAAGGDARPPGRAEPRPDLDHRRHPLRIPDRHPLRDPQCGQRNRHRRRPDL